MNNGNTNLFSYDIGDDVEWLDAQSLAYLDWIEIEILQKKYYFRCICIW